MRVLPLGNFSSTEGCEFLGKAGVAPQWHEQAMRVSRGHPLALALFAEVAAQRDGADNLDLTDDPNVVRVLMSSLIDTAPSPECRHALEACSLLPAMTESMLREALEAAEVSEGFHWLRARSFVRGLPQGLVVHDLARDVLEADLRWRDPRWHRQLRRRIQRHLLSEIQLSAGARQQRLLFDLKFTHRTTRRWATCTTGTPPPGSRWRTPSRSITRPSSPLRAVTRGPGRRSRGVVAAPATEAFSVFRDGADILGYSCYLTLNEADPEDLHRDPGTRAAWAFAQRNGAPTGEDDDVTFLRFIMDAARYQLPSPAFSQRVTLTGRNWFSNPRLSWDFVCFRDPCPLRDEMIYLDYPPLPSAGFSVGDGRYVVFGHDWRHNPMPLWTRLMSRRDASWRATPGVSPPALSRPELLAAVKAALRHLNQPVMLGESPLLGLPPVGGGRCGTRSAADLAATLRSVVESLGTDPRDLKMYRALDRTYLRPAGTHERAAELLGLPFSTYRRHLSQGVVRVADILTGQPGH